MHQIDKRLLPKTDFGEPPPDYIPGLGRGAVGFITRSDIGPANTPQDSSAAPGVGPTMPTAAPMGANVMGPPAARSATFNPMTAGSNNTPHDASDTDNTDYSDTVFDSWNGYSQPLFAHGTYDSEDKEADEQYYQIEERMDGRRRDRRQKKLLEQIQKFHKERPTISHQFSDLKRNLSKLSYDDWSSIPDAQDFSVKQIKNQKYVPVPDSIIEGARREGQSMNSISAGSTGSSMSDSMSSSSGLINRGGNGESGSQTFGNTTTGTSSVLPSSTGLNMLGEARGHLLSIRLDKQTQSVQNTNSVDKTGYLTQLGSLPVMSESDVGDFQKARKLMKNMITIDPQSSHGWIQAARIEEMDGKLQAARSIVSQGLQYCEESEDLWLEAARLETPEVSKAILAKAVTILPQSAKIWMAAAKQEPVNSGSGKQQRIKVLRRALEHVPNDADLWQMLIELQSEQEAQNLLHKAVECLPGNLEMWLALAKLETYEGAKEALNNARKVLRTEPTIWIYAAQLEQSEGRQNQVVEMVIARGLTTLQKYGYILNREDWLNEAEICQQSGHFLTCFAIIKGVILEGLGDTEENQKMLFQDATNYANRNLFVIARSILNVALDTLPNQSEILGQIIQFEFKYQHIVEKLLSEQMLTLMAAFNEKEAINTMLFNAVSAMKQKKQDEEKQKSTIQTGKSQGEIEEEQIQEVDTLKNKDESQNQIIQSTGSDNIQPEITQKTSINKQKQYLELLLERAVKEFPNDQTFWVSAATRFYFNSQNIYQARSMLSRALEVLPNSEKILLLFGKIQKSEKNINDAKVFIEKARNSNPKSVKCWYASVKLQYQIGTLEYARDLAQEATQIFPTFEKLWIILAKIYEKLNQPKETKAAFQRGIEKCIGSKSHSSSVSISSGTSSQATNKLTSSGATTNLNNSTNINNPSNVNLWLAFVEFEARVGGSSASNFAQARPLLEQARLQNPKNAAIWAAAVRLEIKADNKKGAAFLIAQALKQCPQDGILLSLQIELEPKTTRKQILVEALKVNSDDPYVNLSVAKLFWQEQKMEKARKWIEKIITLHPEFGDAWAALYLFEFEQRGKTSADQVLELCNQRRPKIGIIWQEVRNSEGGWALSPAETLLKASIIMNQQFSIIE